MTGYARALRTPRGAAGVTLIGSLTLAALLASSGYDVQSANALAGPGPSAWFGTDELGRDVFVRTLYGLRVDLSLIAVAVPLSALLGTLIGLSGAIAGWLGTLGQRVLDVIVGFPSLILGICVALVLRPGWWALAVAIVLSGLPVFGRLARSTWLAQQERDYVLAARLMNVPGRTVMVRHILPHAADAAVVQTAAGMVAAVFLESALSIVGLGVQPPEPSLGALLNTGMRHMAEQPAYVAGPALILLLLALGLNLLADALTERKPS
ncbi:ABC transporter permease [Actinoplanes sp. OR16]|uniref:ABC transporter permease n=1 Tax=Actinoplanes sp. OR16 TaxID=946334 RepID=UPI000F6E5550|nr:ABC transporter permease [Actinoplanes sp. OR16]BBH70273.1 ABC transporter permease [Actinoplanes sp. OR16]